MRCAHGADIEAKFLDALAKTNAYQAKGGNLGLLAGGRQLTTLRSVKVQKRPKVFLSKNYISFTIQLSLC